MPKQAVQPFRPRGAKPYDKSQRYTLLGERIRSLLGHFRIMGGIKFPGVPIHFKNQDAKHKFYVGAGMCVAGPTHPNFRDLGRLYYVKDNKAYYPIQKDIPLGLLTSSRELLNCLKEWARLRKWATFGDDDDNSAIEEAGNKTLGSDILEEEAKLEEELEEIEVQEELYESREEIEEDDEIVITACRFPYNVKVWVFVSDEEGAAPFYVRVYPTNGYKLTLNAMKDELTRLGIKDGATIEHKYGDTWFFQRWDVSFVAPPEGEELDLCCLTIPGWSEEWTEDMNP
ncbi:hypothetical protein PQX77_000829 [Marasmius sp. AFHP31]|nr:hypothetical protein PQX77_000829 [Marasmius sp. AFHP31]